MDDGGVLDLYDFVLVDINDLYMLYARYTSMLCYAMQCDADDGIDAVIGLASVWKGGFWVGLVLRLGMSCRMDKDYDLAISDKARMMI